MKNVLIMPFETSNGEYILDTNTGTVLPINEIMHKVIDLYSKNTIEEIRNLLKNYYDNTTLEGILNFVERWHNSYNGFYLKNEQTCTNEEEILTGEEIECFLKNGNTFQMILNLTENCNLRCKYCYFSEIYDYTRNRTTNIMTKETGLKALEYFFNFLKPIAKRHPGKHIAISFYGGESLLEFENLKIFVEFTKQNCPLPAHFNITTNGILLNDEIIDFIVTNEIATAISLDGDQNHHDKNRIFPNNEGSFITVLNNIKLFQNKYPNYTNLVTVCTYDFHTDLVEVESFFEENNLPRVVFINAIYNKTTDFYEKFSEFEREEFFRKKELLYRKYSERKIKGEKMSSYLQTFFEMGISSVILRKRDQDNTFPRLQYTGTCVPGFKINVRADGIFDICERVNPTMPIGNIVDGLNYNNMVEIIKSYNKEIISKCHYCVIKYNCSLCYASCMDNGKFVFDEEYCKNTQNLVKRSFSDTYSILEKNKNVFSEFDFDISILYK